MLQAEIKGLKKSFDKQVIFKKLAYKLNVGKLYASLVLAALEKRPFALLEFVGAA